MRSLERSIEVTFCRLELRLVVNHSSSDCYTAGYVVVWWNKYYFISYFTFTVIRRFWSFSESWIIWDKIGIAPKLYLVCIAYPESDRSRKFNWNSTTLWGILLHDIWTSECSRSLNKVTNLLGGRNNTESVTYCCWITYRPTTGTHSSGILHRKLTSLALWKYKKNPHSNVDKMLIAFHSFI